MSSDERAFPGRSLAEDVNRLHSHVRRFLDQYRRLDLQAACHTARIVAEMVTEGILAHHKLVAKDSPRQNIGLIYEKLAKDASCLEGYKEAADHLTLICAVGNEGAHPRRHAERIFRNDAGAVIGHLGELLRWYHGTILKTDYPRRLASDFDRLTPGGGWRIVVWRVVPVAVGTLVVLLSGYLAADWDGDGVMAVSDNCWLDANPDQEDLDNDGLGDVCDLDRDGDGTRDDKDCVPGDPAVHPIAKELCNGRDDNCDGVTDEGFEVGKKCSDGIGQCLREGEYVCGRDGDEVVCPVEVGQPETEVCDGEDNDCDGVTDEEFGKVTCGKGVCSQEVETCVNGVQHVCDEWKGKAPEVCDGNDNDCDGETDEDWPEIGQDCRPGKGECENAGKYICSPDGTGKMCTASPTRKESKEYCDGKDNDCDGLTDEELGTSECGVGGCRRPVENCVDGRAVPCVPGPPSEETCNGVDDDCNGMTDDGLERSERHSCPNPLGLGEWRASCVEGTWQLTIESCTKPRE